MTVGDLLKSLGIYSAVAALGILGLIYSVGPMDHQFEFNDLKSAWPSVLGLIVSSRAEAVLDSRTRKVNVTVNFTYVVEGQMYSGEEGWSGENLIPLDFNLGAANRARAIKDRYIPGMRLLVYYDPSKPSEGLLRPSGGWPVWWLL